MIKEVVCFVVLGSCDIASGESHETHQTDYKYLFHFLFSLKVKEDKKV
jgi:hypothetical protein